MSRRETHLWAPPFAKPFFRLCRPRAVLLQYLEAGLEIGARGRRRSSMHGWEAKVRSWCIKPIHYRSYSSTMFYVPSVVKVEWYFSENLANSLWLPHLVWVETDPRGFPYPGYFISTLGKNTPECTETIINMQKTVLILSIYYVYLQCEAPKIAKLVYNSNNYGLWYL
jgi:hypothetical protein